MNIIMKDTKGCGQLLSNDTFFDDIRLSGVKIAKEASVEGVDYCVPLYISHKGFYCIR